MKKAKLITEIDPLLLGSVKLDDFSRFKEKLIMINTLKSLVDETDKGILKAITVKKGGGMTTKSLKKALAEIVDAAIERIKT